MITDMYELSARYDSRQSFYGKAHVLIDGNKRILRSYDTNVACVDLVTNTIEIYGIWSVTTSRHQREFAKQFGFNLKGALREGKFNKEGERV